ncbi:MAG: twin-arginine translocase subunit TatC [Candidatus Dormibacteraeota bacterium]|nr:twin-arginine translocase subunit TatC [Candidatus Dormibacteraeota bacterium]
MTIVEHLEELRRVLIVSLLAWFAGTVLAFVFNGVTLGILLHPLKTVLAHAHSIVNTAIFTSPTEGLTVPIKIAAIVGFILALPVILWQTWLFVSPGLRPVERRFVGPFIASALVLFAGGAAFAYFVMPIGLNFLATFLGGNAMYFPDIDQYLSFFLLLTVVFGVTFEMPMVLVILGLLGIISSTWLRKRRRGAYVFIIIGALIVTPGADPFTPTALAIPLLVLYEVAILVLARVFHR